MSILVSMHSVLLAVACDFDLNFDLDLDMEVDDMHPVGAAVLDLDLLVPTPMPMPLPVAVDGAMVIDGFFFFFFFIIWSWRPSSSLSETTGIAYLVAGSSRPSLFSDIRGQPTPRALPRTREKEEDAAAPKSRLHMGAARTAAVRIQEKKRTALNMVCCSQRVLRNGANQRSACLFKL